MKILLVTLFLALFSLAASSQTTPDATVRAFYKYSNARSSTFNKRHIELRKQWYTTDLYDAFVKQLAADDAHLMRNPTDKPFFGDGLDFRPLDEPCEVGDRTYKRVQSVGRTEIDKSRATVDVTFKYPASCTSGGDPIVYRVNLQKTGGRWLIDDWTYPEGSTLKGDMREHKYN